MPSTHNSGDELEQQIDEIEHFLHVRRRLEQLRAQLNIQMVANNDNRPLKEFFAPSQDEHNRVLLTL